MSDQVIISLASSAVGLIGTIFTAIMVYFMARLKTQADKAAVEVKHVADTLSVTSTKTETKLNNIAKVTDATHKLSNSMYGRLLRVVWVLSERIYQLTGVESDKKLAEEAKRDFDSHEKQQAQVDAAYPEGIQKSAT